MDVEGMEKTERLRFGMLLEVRGLMDRGEISSKPEEGEKAGRREKITVGREAHKERGGIGKEDKKDKSDKSSPKPVVEDADEFFESE